MMFEELLAQLEQRERAEFHATASDLAQAETSATTLAERLAGQRDSDVTLQLDGGHDIQGRLLRCHSGWLIVERDGREQLVIAHAIVTISDLGRTVGPPPSPVESRLTIAHALRRIAAARQPVVVRLRSGGRVQGLIQRVGADHLDLGPASPATGVHQRRVTVALSALAAVTPATD